MVQRKRDYLKVLFSQNSHKRVLLIMRNSRKEKRLNRCICIFIVTFAGKKTDYSYISERIRQFPILDCRRRKGNKASRATILFTCRNEEIQKAVYFIHDYFSSPEINKREKFLVKKLNFSEYGIVRYEQVLHDS